MGRKRVMKVVLIYFIVFLMLSLTACGKKGSTETETNNNTSSAIGLTSIEASKLAYETANKIFKDAVLWCMAPVEDKESSVMNLDKNWPQNDSSSAWFFWYAENNGADWFMISIKGKSIVWKDIGTRSFSALDMNATWTREKLLISLKEAASKAKAQGANLGSLTWAEYNCDYPASDFRMKPCWVLIFSENIASGSLPFTYTMFVDGISGVVLGAINDKGEKISLPIDRESLSKPHENNHEKDLTTFFDLLSKKDYDFAVFQLAYELSPSDAAAQMWRENFQSIKFIKVVSIEQANLPQWTQEREYYKVTLEVKTDASPEKYGWENGINVRWISIIPQGGGPWKIAEFATSP